MIFAHTWQQVLDGTKTQTRRLVNEGVDYRHDNTIYRNNRAMWTVGKTYAVQPARGKKQIARIELDAIRLERVCDITHEDARGEGFASIAEFSAVWESMHGKPANEDERPVWVLTFKLLEDTTC